MVQLRHVTDSWPQVHKVFSLLKPHEDDVVVVVVVDKSKQTSAECSWTVCSVTKLANMWEQANWQTYCQTKEYSHDENKQDLHQSIFTQVKEAQSDIVVF